MGAVRCVRLTGKEFRLYLQSAGREGRLMRKMIISIVAIVSIAGIAITALAISERY